ncbi:MAG: sigma-70 family RNA polymerase sigma factor [Planctomycetota bacterium]
MNEREATRDDELIRAHLNGSADAFKTLVEHHAPNLASVLERMVRDYHLALDLAQEAFIKVHRMLPGYTFKGKFRSMLYTIALNSGRDALRKKQRTPLVFLDEARTRLPENPASSSRECSDLRSRIEAALDRIPSPYKEAVYLRDVVGLTYAEVSASQKCSVGTVKSRVNRGRLIFRDAFLNVRAKKDQGGQNHAS